jgi:putative FmdB family regulatory protein
MPIYEYKCVLCEHAKDVTKSFDEANIVELCDKCGAAMIKQYGNVGVQFKGNGFYKTDKPK